ncbi:LptF/LptG family permease [Crocinitomix sp.]|nr:LptF/LptG family permease [Crocinitomix sp.]
MKKFLGTFVFMLILLMSISIVFDLSEKLNDFIANGAPWDEIIFVYYSNFFIYYGAQFSYLLNFISVIWFTSKMAGNTEIVPILSAGIGFNRFLRPYFISSAILVLATILVYNFVLPASNSARIQFEETYYRDKNNRLNVRMQLSQNDILYFHHYDGAKGIISDFSFQRLEGTKIDYLLLAQKAVGDSTNNNWHFDNVQIRYFGEFNDDVNYIKSLDTTLSFGISDLVFRPNIIEAMDGSELDEFIEKQRQSGSEKIPVYLIEKHKRWASPFAIFILTLIGVSVSSKKTRGGLGINIAIGLGICVLYIFAMQMTTVAALNVGFTPILAVWLPNIIFSFIAYFLYLKAPK